jgi:imidazolonepropionase-like amidohydrolase
VEKVAEFFPDRITDLIAPRPLLIVTNAAYDVHHPLAQVQAAFGRAGEPKKLGGATLFIAGRGFVAPGGGPTVSPLEHVPFEVDRPELARLLVRELIAQKVDMIKVWVDDRLGTRPKLPPELYAVIIDEAHKHGARVMAHVYYLADAKELVRIGVDGLAHMVRDVEVDDEFVQLAKARNLFICAALSAHVKPVDAWVDDPAFAETSPFQVRERLRAGQTGLPAIPASMQVTVLLPRVRNSMRKLKAAGVRFVLGGDTGIPSRFHGFNEHLELEAMVDAGLTPLEAIAAGTSVPAQILGLTDRGALSVGKSADFIVLDANPVEDIKNTKRIAQVYRQGRAVDRTSLRSAWQH